MRARVVAFAVAATIATPASAEAEVAVTGSSTRLPTGAVAVTVKNTGSEEVRFLRMLFGAPFAVTPQTAPCQGAGPGEVFCPFAPGAFPPGGQLTLQQLVTPLFPDGTPIAGRASADGVTDVQFSIPGPVAGGPDIAVDLTGDQQTTPGATVRCKLTIRNVGTAPSRGGSVEIDYSSTGGVSSGFTTAGIISSDPRAAKPLLRAFDDDDSAYGILTVFFPALAPGESSQAEFDVVHPSRSTSLLQGGLLLFDPVGTRTLRATLVGADPEPGPNSDTLRTAFENAEPAIDSTIHRPKGVPREIAGTASGSVGGVEVAVVRASGGAKAAAATCSWLASTRGTFKRRPATAVRCRTPIWLEAAGTKRWTLRLSRRLARGSYVVYSRAITKKGAPEVRFSAGDGNRVALTVR